MKFILLKKGRVALVSDEDFKKISEYKWYVIGANPQRPYIAAKIKGKMIYLHRFITNAPEGFEVDHLNGNSLDNTRKNLRVCTHQENMTNTSRTRKKRERILKTQFLDNDTSKR